MKKNRRLGSIGIPSLPPSSPNTPPTFFQVVNTVVTYLVVLIQFYGAGRRR